MKKYTSNAQWPDCVHASHRADNVSTDTHDTRRDAEIICNILMKQGFGGDRSIRPLRVWVEEVEE